MPWIERGNRLVVVYVIMANTVSISEIPNMCPAVHSEHSSINGSRKLMNFAPLLGSPSP
ncbi:MAG: hypothetical protein OER74_21085 [Desulfobacteraceae bacterium]|nr:hypothetical protein [Desulfobacteraceae bacterium]